MRRQIIPQRLRHLLRRGADLVPPTWSGSLLALLSGLALWLYGFGTLDLVLFVVGIAGCVLVGLSSLVVGLTAFFLSGRLPPSGTASERLEAGSPIRTGFCVPAFSRLPLVKIRWDWLRPDGVEVRIRQVGRLLAEEVVATRRCQVAVIRRRFVVRGAFGLSRVAWEHDDPGPLTVLPHVGRLRQGPVVQSMAAAEGIAHPIGSPEGDRMEIRRYTPGDSMRHILWKTFARTRQLNVRIPERSIHHSRKTVAYLVTGPDDEAAAAAARVALEAGSLGEQWLFGADGTETPTSDLGPALEAIARSGSWARNGDDRTSGLDAFLRQAAAEGEVHCIVFAPARTGEWTTTALQAARGGALSFVLGTDGVVRADRPPLWQRLLFATEPATGTPAPELAAVLRTLAGAGCPALVVDRASGRSYGEAHHQALGGRG